MSLLSSFDNLYKAFIRPPRQSYQESDLGSKTAVYGNYCYKRLDFVLKNSRNLQIKCSFYEPIDIRNTLDGNSDENGSLFPCVLYAHCNSGSRIEALTHLECLISRGLGLFSLDFAGSGLSEGEHVSLGHFEWEDVAVAVDYLRRSGKVSNIGIWGRSMGAVTALLYAAQFPLKIQALVIDSPFSSLRTLAVEIASQKSTFLPKFLIEYILEHVRQQVLEKANFDIEALELTERVKNIEAPAVFACSSEDQFIAPQHTQRLFEQYRGGKRLIKLRGGHNAARQREFVDTVADFMLEKLSTAPKKSHSTAKFFSSFIANSAVNQSTTLAPQQQQQQQQHKSKRGSPQNGGATGKDSSSTSESTQASSLLSSNISSARNAPAKAIDKHNIHYSSSLRAQQQNFASPTHEHYPPQPLGVMNQQQQTQANLYNNGAYDALNAAQLAQFQQQVMNIVDQNAKMQMAVPAIRHCHFPSIDAQQGAELQNYACNYTTLQTSPFQPSPHSQPVIAAPSHTPPQAQQATQPPPQQTDSWQDQSFVATRSQRAIGAYYANQNSANTTMQITTEVRAESPIREEYSIEMIRAIPARVAAENITTEYNTSHSPYRFRPMAQTGANAATRKFTIDQLTRDCGQQPQAAKRKQTADDNSRNQVYSTSPNKNIQQRLITSSGGAPANSSVQQRNAQLEAPEGAAASIDNSKPRIISLAELHGANNNELIFFSTSVQENRNEEYEDERRKNIARTGQTPKNQQRSKEATLTLSLPKSAAAEQQQQQQQYSNNSNNNQLYSQRISLESTSNNNRKVAISPKDWRPINSQVQNYQSFVQQECRSAGVTLHQEGPQRASALNQQTPGLNEMQQQQQQKTTTTNNSSSSKRTPVSKIFVSSNSAQNLNNEGSFIAKNGNAAPTTGVHSVQDTRNSIANKKSNLQSVPKMQTVSQQQQNEGRYVVGAVKTIQISLQDAASAQAPPTRNSHPTNSSAVRNLHGTNSNGAGGRPIGQRSTEQLLKRRDEVTQHAVAANITNNSFSAQSNNKDTSLLNLSFDQSRTVHLEDLYGEVQTVPAAPPSKARDLLEQVRAKLQSQMKKGGEYENPVAQLIQQQRSFLETQQNSSTNSILGTQTNQFMTYAGYASQENNNYVTHSPKHQSKQVSTNYLTLNPKKFEANVNYY